MTTSNLELPRTIDYPRVVSRAEWLEARKALLAKEKEATQARDALSAERRTLPMVRSRRSTSSRGRRDAARSPICSKAGASSSSTTSCSTRLGRGCPTCSFVADNFAGSLVHLAARDTAFAVISRAPLDKIERFKKRMGWNFPWLSSFGTDFNYDFRVTLDEDHTEYNYAPVSAQPAGRPQEGEREGLSVFLRDGERVFHTYSTYQRGLDPLLNTYNFLDLTPLGRQEEEGIMRWLRHHDKY